MFFLLAFLSLAVELAVGYPDRLFRRIGHPVTWIGRLIGLLDETLNRPAWSRGGRRTAGVAALAVLVVIAGGIGLSIQSFLGYGPGLLVTAVLASSLLAQRSLASHVEAVAAALEKDGLEAGRRAVSQIVGRDTAQLDKAGVSRAAIESLAENFSDGVVAPAFWLAVLGLPGALIYKAVNTADSMIGQRTRRHKSFGWASARLDDLVNLPASRLSALLLCGAAVLVREGSWRKGWRAVRRDAWRHRSPNAGWPEAAMAGVLGLALAGPRTYAGMRVDDPYMGEGGRREVTASDIRRALRLYRAADMLLIALIAFLALLFALLG